MSVQSSNSPIHGTCTIGQPYGITSTKYSCSLGGGKYLHTGIDFPASGVSSYDIYSVCEGDVVYTQTGTQSQGGSPALGNQVQIKDSVTGLFYRFCHLLYGSISVSVGQHVTRGTKIGVMGNTGNSFGRHLHLECSRTQSWSCSSFLSPGEYLGFGNIRGTVIEYVGGDVPIPPTPSPDPPIPGSGAIYERIGIYGKYNGSLENNTGILNEKQKEINARYIWNCLENKGWSLNSASVIIGYSDMISTLNPGAWNPLGNTNGYFGLMGWNYQEFVDLIHSGGEYVYSQDPTEIDNSIERLAWFVDYNLAWNNETLDWVHFATNYDTSENLAEIFASSYAYYVGNINTLKEKSRFWFDFNLNYKDEIPDEKKKNNWKNFAKQNVKYIIS